MTIASGQAGRTHVDHPVAQLGRGLPSGSVGKAARALGLSQPAVSGHIASLEAQIERQLCTRHARGVKPSAIADELAQRISLALDTAENALAEVKSRSALLSGTIHICGPTDILSDLIVPPLQALIANGLAVHLIPSNDAAQIEMRLDGRADFAFSVWPSADPCIGQELYGQDELILVADPKIADAIKCPEDLTLDLTAAPYPYRHVHGRPHPGQPTAPDDAYRFGKGAEMIFNGGPHKIKRPLDFVAITDHSEFMGEAFSLMNEGARCCDNTVAVSFRAAPRT